MSSMSEMMKGRGERCFKGKEKKNTRTYSFGKTYRVLSVCDQRERKVRVL